MVPCNITFKPPNNIAVPLYDGMQYDRLFVWGRRGEVRAGPRLKRERENAEQCSRIKERKKNSGKITPVGDLIN